MKNQKLLFATAVILLGVAIFLRFARESQPVRMPAPVTGRLEIADSELEASVLKYVRNVKEQLLELEWRHGPAAAHGGWETIKNVLLKVKTERPNLKSEALDAELQFAEGKLKQSGADPAFQRAEKLSDKFL